MTIKYVREQRSEGEILRGKKSMLHDIGTKFLIAIIAAFLTMMALLFVTANYGIPREVVYAGMVVIFIGILLINLQPGGVLVDQEQRRLKAGRDWIQADDIGEIYLTRNIIAKRPTRFKRRPGRGASGHRRRRTRYIATWYVVAKLMSNEKELIKHSVSSFKSHDNNLYNQIWVQQIAEDIAEMFNIPMVDATGIEPVRRGVGETDLPLKQILTDEGVEPYNGQLPPELANEFEVETIAGGYKIRDKDLDFNLGPLLAIVIFGIIAVVAGTSSQEIFYFSLGGLGLMVLFFFNSFFSRNFVEITPNSITLIQKGTVFNIFKESMKLDDLERIVKIQVARRRGIELVSDTLRIPMFGKFSEEELDSLKETISRVLVKVV